MLSFTEADFPEEVSNRNVIGLDLVVAVYDNYEGDNEENAERRGSCVAGSRGEAAFGPASFTAETPNGGASDHLQESIYVVFMLADLPDFGPQPQRDRLHRCRTGSHVRRIRRRRR